MKTSECRERECRAAMVWLVSSRDATKRVPVDAESLNDDDIEAMDRGEDVTFDASRGHVSRFTTCAKPAQFSKRR